MLNINWLIVRLNNWLNTLPVLLDINIFLHFKGDTSKTLVLKCYAKIQSFNCFVHSLDVIGFLSNVNIARHNFLSSGKRKWKR